MDNQTYLNKISAKPLAVAQGKNKFLTPNMIKLFSGLGVAIILLIVIMNILGQSGARAKTLTETLYSRMSEFSKNSGLLDNYTRYLNSSHLRALTVNLKTNLTNTVSNLALLLPDLSINPNKLPTSVQDSEANYLVDLNKTLETARLNALLDRTFPAQMSLEIARILAMENELHSRTNNSALLDLLNKSLTDLKVLEAEFTNFDLVQNASARQLPTESN